MNRSQQNYGSISGPSVGFAGTNSQELNSLCDSVVTNLYTINGSIKTLDNALKTIGTKRDNQGLRNNVHVTQLSTNQIASTTTKNIAKLKSLVVKAGKQEQLQVEKLEENFKETINRYYSLQKEVANKQKAHLLVSVSIENEPTTPDDEENRQKHAQMAGEFEFEQGMLLERESRIKQIESDVLDVNEIMRELGSIVSQQGETIDTIENSIDHATGNVELGTEQLLQASRYSNRSRKKLLILAVIGLIIVIIIILIVFIKK
ncbi:unnamed protein product [Brassicogethes aeneus]|uniref:t-SNARE coiled-coil homology domain-containing protein n=1 Tax=Brassicogethes aeneus TaxID=1431903 RepID=A0A9P0FK70_BRAAE|nr:unnamed protein product [Brassicogethes aeneus]